MVKQTIVELELMLMTVKLTVLELMISLTVLKASIDQRVP